jgi:hypothetical protein
MKKILVGLMLAVMLFTGCAGLTVNTGVSVATETAYVLVLKNNPQLKPVAVQTIEAAKKLLTGSLTYTDLMLFFNDKLKGEYAVLFPIITYYITTDQPVINSIPMFDAYKADIVKMLDRFLLLSNLQK